MRKVLSAKARHLSLSLGAAARRHRAHEPRRLAADFVIGAHARAVGRLVTRDAAFYERNFPSLTVLLPRS